MKDNWKHRTKRALRFAIDRADKHVCIEDIGQNQVNSMKHGCHDSQDTSVLLTDLSKTQSRLEELPEPSCAKFIFSILIRKRDEEQLWRT